MGVWKRTRGNKKDALATRRAQMAARFIDRLVHIAEREGVRLDAYSWTPDPAGKAVEFYYLTVSSRARHSQAKFAKAFFEDSAPDIDPAVNDVLTSMISALTDS